MDVVYKKETNMNNLTLIVFSVGLIGIIGFCVAVCWDEKRIEERFNGNDDEGFEDNPNKTETPIWRKE
jgi:hypothetical protein